ncbi:MAG: hypothetical protein ABSA16_10010 [Thermoguttaceae bacterium]|jgi:hypothetical protein
MNNTPPLTSTVEIGKPFLVAQTPQVEPVVFTQVDFIKTLERVRRKQGKPSIKPDQEKPAA